MMYVLYGLNGILFVGSVACFVMVIIKMFQNNDKGIAITSLVLIPCCLIGMLVAFVFGWVKVGQYNIKNVMLAWTGIIIVNMVLGAIGQTIAAKWTDLHIPADHHAAPLKVDNFAANAKR